jgi:hypothetical protein
MERDAYIDWNGSRRLLRIQIGFIIGVAWIGVAAVGGQAGDGGCSWRGVGAGWGVRQLAQPIQFISALDCAKNEKLPPFRWSSCSIIVTRICATFGINCECDRSGALNASVRRTMARSTPPTGRTQRIRSIP